MKVFIVRHGETKWNKERRIQGREDIPLNEFGRSLARKTKEGLRHIPFDVVFTSPLKRAKETASIITEGRGLLMIEEERIKEMSFGEYEGRRNGRKYAEVPEEFHLFFKDPARYNAPPGGETFLEVKERTGEFLKELFAREGLKNSTILVVTHGAALAAMLNTLKQESIDQYWGCGVHKNCGVTELEVTENMVEIISEDRVYYDDAVEPWEE